MKYSGIKVASIENGIGCRTSFFVSGCRHHCKGCFNALTWDFNNGADYTEEVEQQILDTLKQRYVTGLTILGGEPLEPENQPYVRRLVEKVRKQYPNKTVWIYTGFTWEELFDSDSRAYTEHILPILKMIEVLVDGRFEYKLKDLSLKFRGSSNQRVIDVPLSLAKGEVVISHYLDD